MIGGTTVDCCEWAYIAGIIDGEGTIALARVHPQEMPSPELSISNTNLEVLKWIQKRTGGRIQKKKAMKANHRDAYVLRLRRSHALRVLKIVIPFLLIKKQQAELLISHYLKLTPRNGRYSSEILKKKLLLVEHMKKLNKRSR